MTTTTGDMVAYLKARARQHKTRAREADRRVDELEAQLVAARDMSALAWNLADCFLTAAHNIDHATEKDTQ